MYILNITVQDFLYCILNCGWVGTYVMYAVLWANCVLRGRCSISVVCYLLTTVISESFVCFLFRNNLCLQIWFYAMMNLIITLVKTSSVVLWHDCKLPANKKLHFKTFVLCTGTVQRYKQSSMWCGQTMKTLDLKSRGCGLRSQFRH